MANETEKELLGSDLVSARNDLFQHTTQMGGGFYQLSKETDFEDQYPNAINEFLQTDGVVKIANDAGIDKNSLLPPLQISDEAINKINDLIGVDPLNLSESDITQLRSSVDEILSEITVPTADQLLTFIDNYKQFVTAAASENIAFPTNFREIRLVSTDTSLDTFIERTGIRKLVAIKSNKLAYPFITERVRVPSQRQAILTNSVGLKNSDIITYGGVIKDTGVVKIGPGSKILITNNAKSIKDVLQQKTVIEWISESSKTIRINPPLLFDLSSDFLVEIYQYTVDNVLSPGDLIKIPK